MVPVLVAAAALAGLPQHGVLVPGRSLGGVRVGDTQAQVRARLGRSFGVCDDCKERTWYFTYKPFTQQGLAVGFRDGRVSAIYTLWQPKGWHATTGQRLGDPAPSGVATVACEGYKVRVTYHGKVMTAYYVVDGKLWGFGLLSVREQVCR